MLTVIDFMSSSHCSQTNRLNLEISDSRSCLLGVDTATQACSVAVSIGSDLVVETTTVARETHSRHLLSMIRTALGRARIELSDLDGFVVTKGPGSFTGLRIGLSTIKGLAKAAEKPVVGVSYLECLARQSGATDGLVCALMDARRQEYYYAAYRIGDSGVETVVPETVGSLSHLAAVIETPCHFIGNGISSNRQCLRHKLDVPITFAPDCLNVLRAHTIVDAGRALLENGYCSSMDNLVPEYIRKSDAQVNLEKRMAAVEPLPPL